MSMVEITAIVNAHREGLLAYPTLLSLRQAVEHAEDRGLCVELLFVLDRADYATTEVFKANAVGAKRTRIVMVDHGDLGLSRNSGALAAQGEWLAFLDADDLWCANWLSAAHAAAAIDPRNVVWHPEVSVYFGEHFHILNHIDSEDPAYNVALLAMANYWTSLCFVRRSLVLQVPYPESDLRNQIGFEDWGWNMATIESGALHKVVPSTGHAIRVKPTSLVKETTSASCLPHPSAMFRRILAERWRLHERERVGWCAKAPIR
jgi:glycosyltransferase involved in cell wall biosynthesis